MGFRLNSVNDPVFAFFFFFFFFVFHLLVAMSHSYAYAIQIRIRIQMRFSFDVNKKIFYFLSSDITCFRLWIFMYNSFFLFIFCLSQFICAYLFVSNSLWFWFLLCVCLWYQCQCQNESTLYICLKLTVLFTALNCWLWSSFSRIMIPYECMYCIFVFVFEFVYI